MYQNGCYLDFYDHHFAIHTDIKSLRGTSEIDIVCQYSLCLKEVI